MSEAPMRPKVVGGAELQDVAIALLGDDTLHYRDWHARLHWAGYVIGGQDPLALFLTSIARHPLVERVGDGTYRVDPEGWAALGTKANWLRQQIIDHIDQPERREQLLTELRSIERLMGQRDERAREALAA